MDVTEAGVLERDGFVLDSLATRYIPTILLTSGGYTARSHALIVQSTINARQLLEAIP